MEPPRAARETGTKILAVRRVTGIPTVAKNVMGM